MQRSAVMRVVVVKGAMVGVVVALLHLHLHHPLHGPKIDYVGLAAAAFVSWLSIPGPGESLLIAEGIVAARHNLDITSVIAVAWAGAAAGGMAGWFAGRHLGRRIVTARGPFHRARIRTVARGEAIFERHTFMAIYLTPSWVSGIHGVRTVVFTLVNAVTAVIWAVVIGLGAYFAGPPIIDLVSDMGLATSIALGVLIAGSLTAEYFRRRRARARRRQV